MRWSNAVQCPHCDKEQIDGLDDLVEVGDMEGSFEQECEECNKKFTIHFEYRPYNRTTQ